MRFPAARRFFRVDARVHRLAVLGQLVRRGEAKAEVLEQAIGKDRLGVPASEALISR
jgi:pyruvate dehydrogenase complex dehydrogenase (E1) component